MLLGSSTKYGAGITVAGDYGDLIDLHETIHYFGSESGPIPPHQSEFLLGLAYDVRHAYQGDRDKTTMRTPNAMYTYFAVDVLWPIFLVQVAMLRSAAAYLPTGKAHQANLYRLEACAESAMNALDGKVARECSRWLAEYSVFPANFLINFVSRQTYRYVFSSTTAQGRVRALPDIMREISPTSDAYQAYEKELKAIAAKEQCRPEDLHDLSEWPEFKW